MPHRGIFLYGRLQISSILNRPKRTPRRVSHFHLITTSARSTLCGFKLSASLVASCAQLCLHKRSSLKNAPQGIFFTVGFKSLRILSRPKKTPRRVSHFHLITTSARSALCGFKLSASLVASCAQLCLHKRSSLKMPHRGIFFWSASNPFDSKQTKKDTPVGCHTFILSLLLPEVLCADLNFPPRLLRPVHSYASINAPP